MKPTKRTTINSSIKGEPSTLFKTVLVEPTPKKVVLENELLPVAEVGEDERSFIESETKIKQIKMPDKDREKPVKDLQKKRMLKSTVIIKEK